ncbi:MULTISPECIES: hypothetical protein [Cupriavidus]
MEPLRHTPDGAVVRVAVENAKDQVVEVSPGCDRLVPGGMRLQTREVMLRWNEPTPVALAVASEVLVLTLVHKLILVPAQAPAPAAR